MDEIPKYELRHISDVIKKLGVNTIAYSQLSYKTDSVLDLFKQLKINTWRRGCGSDIFFEGKVVAHTRHYESHMRTRTQKNAFGFSITIRPTFKGLLAIVDAEKTYNTQPLADTTETS